MTLTGQVFQHRRGTNAENNAYTGQPGEITFDTDTNELRIHDGVTLGGWIIGTAGGLSTSSSTTRGAGPAGEDGEDGLPGAPGAQGPQGPQGLTGADGEDGVDGLPGVAGPAGPQGAKGLPGDDGPEGDAGPAGPAGAPGLRGQVGPPGQDGDDGADGPSGLSAATMLIAPANPNSLQLVFSEEWIGGSSEIGNHCWNRETVGTAGIFTYAAQETSSTQLTKDHPGVIYIAAGLFNEPVVGDEACIVAQDVDALLVGAGYRFETLVYLQGVEATPGTNAYGVFRIGLGDSLNYNDHNDGVYFEVDPSQSSGNWRLRCISNGTASTTAASVLKPAGGNWYHLLCEVAPDASLAAFWAWIPGSTAPALLGTVTTNIPTGAGRSCGPNLQVCAVTAVSPNLTVNNVINCDKFLLYSGRPVR